MLKQKIAIVDSGMGGIGVLKIVSKLLPNAHFVFFADNEALPYGEKTADFVVDRLEKICQYLIDEEKVNIICLACNTATSVSISFLRKNFPISFVGMEPAIKPALENDRNQKIIVLSTPITQNNSRFLSKYAFDKRLEFKSFCSLAQMVEDSVFSLSSLLPFIDGLFSDAEKRTTDAIVLGCSHYVLLKPLFSRIFKKNISFYDSDMAVAQRIQFLAKRKDLKPLSNLRVSFLMTKWDSSLSKKYFKLFSE